MRPTAKRLLQSGRLKALIVSDLTNVFYLSGCRVSAGCVLVRPSGYALYVDARYTEAAKRNAIKGVVVRPLEKFFTDLSAFRAVGVEADAVTLARLSRWKRACKRTRFTETTGLVEEFRRKKSPQELRLLRRAQSLTRALLKAVPALLKTGITERQLAWELQKRAMALGADGMSFDTIVAFGTHTSSPHHHPTDRALVRGDLVQIDIGAQVGGYCGDLSDVFFTGPKSVRQEEVYRALKQAKNIAKRHMKAGDDSRAADREVRRLLAAHGLEQFFTHALGHGVGLDVHEGVTLSVRAKQASLQDGEVVTVEPGVYIPGAFGMRLEDMVFVR